MTVSLVNLPTDSSTDALYQQWASGLSAAFTAVGFNKTSDAGQVVWDGTKTSPRNATVSSPNWEIREFSDPLQATSPVFVKIWYASSPGNANNPALLIEVGTNSDGSGNLTGNVSSLFTVAPYQANTPATPCYISSDGGRINVGLWAGTQYATACGFYIERLKNDSGAPIGDGVNVVTHNSQYSGGKQQQFIPKNGTGPVFPNIPFINFVCQSPPIGTGAYGNNLGVFPICPNRGFTDNPDLGGLAFFQQDMPVGGVLIPISLYGVVHNYVLLANSGPTSGNNGNGNAVCMAVRYE